MSAVILSYGGGKDSTVLVAIDENRDESAAYLGISREVLDAAFPQFDYAVFSDPGAEFSVTYQTVQRVEAVLGSKFIRVRRNGETISEWCLRLGIVPVMAGGSHVCSKKFKGDVLAAWAKDAGMDSPTWLIGIEADEGRRVKRFTAPKGDTATYRYPLVELGLNREMLDGLLTHLGWENVHKSSCVFCPFMSEAEITDMILYHPKEWELVTEVEAAFRNASSVKNTAWLAAGSPLNAGGRAPKGMWRKDSWSEGARLFIRTIQGRKLSVQEWEQRVRSLTSDKIPLMELTV